MQKTLKSELKEIFRLTEGQHKALGKLGLETCEDLLRYTPTRYISEADVRAIQSISAGERITLEGKISGLDFEKTWKKHLRIAKAKLSDETGAIRLVWFHQPYIAKILKDGDLVQISGKVSEHAGYFFISNPLYEKIDRLSYRGAGAGLTPVYPETRGISSRWLRYHIQKIFVGIPREAFEDPLPETIRARYHLPPFFTALRALHFPKNEKEVEAARKRLAFEEIFYIQLSRMGERLALEKKQSPAVPADKKKLKEFLSRLPFTLTKTQRSILELIESDMARETPMARLLEGDVGSGKTVIAASLAWLTASAGFQSTYMAPTEILARQHFENFSRYLCPFNMKIGLFTSSEARVFPSKAFRGKSAHIPKSQLIRWLLSGEIKILIGTHALLGAKVTFKNLAFIVVDEQHRFGVWQRRKLAARKSLGHDLVPHFLSMTATPIPRTLALTIFGDLDLAVLDEVPPGKAEIITDVFIKPSARSWDRVRREIEKGQQAFFVCPRISAGDDEKQKSVKEEFKKISTEVFPEFRSGMLHGKMSAREKDAAMKKFRDGTIDILVSTSLIEVGIDIPNATIMVVEGAERFGLAQLHQLRGRIGRGKHTSYFIAVTESSSEKTRLRLKALKEARNGFELAEYDLHIRGPGELTGHNQWGISDLGMEALKNLKMVEAAREEARKVLLENRGLTKYPLLEAAVKKFDRNLYHFE